MKDLLWLIPALPLAGFLVNALVRLPRTAAAVVGCAGPFAAFALSIAAFQKAPPPQRVFEWITVGTDSVAFGLSVDPLAAIMLLVVTGVGSLIHIYSIGYMHEDAGFSRYFAYLNLFMFAMLVLVMADNILVMFVGWEGVGLCSYLLIGFWYKDLKNADAGKKAFITNRVGDVGFLLGIFCVWKLCGTLEFSKMTAGADPTLARAAALFLFLGACGKSAQIPLHVWLPDAMAGPTPVSALIHAATMVTAGVYMVARMGFLYVAAPFALDVMAWVAGLTALMAALVAVSQNDLKKILAYSTVSQLGFMFAGMASAQFTTGIFHVVTHAFFKALLFLGAGAIIHALSGEQDIRKMGGLSKPLRLVFITFLIGSLALAGMPFLSGYYSKDLILGAALERSPALFGVLVLTAAITAFYTARMLILVFLLPGSHPHLHKPGITMTAPLIILATLSFFGGMFLNSRIQTFLDAVHVSKSSHLTAMIASFAAFIAGFGLAVVCFRFARDAVRRWVEGPGKWIHALVSRKFFVDEAYDYLVVAPLKTGATVAWFLVDRILIDRVLVEGSGRATCWVGGLLRRAHTGSLNVGLMTFGFGLAAALTWLIWRFAL